MLDVVAGTDTEEPPSWPSGIGRTADGRYVVMANRGPNTVASFRVLPGPAPSLELVDEIDCGGDIPRDLTVVDDSVYVANQESGTVTVLGLDPTDRRAARHRRAGSRCPAPPRFSRWPTGERRDDGLPDRPAAGPARTGEDRQGAAALVRTGRASCRSARCWPSRGASGASPPTARWCSTCTIGTIPQSRDRKGKAGILFMGTGDYVALRERYGDHVVDGIAGETVLLDAPDGLAGGGLPRDGHRADGRRSAGTARRPDRGARVSSSAGSACVRRCRRRSTTRSGRR